MAAGAGGGSGSGSAGGIRAGRAYVELGLQDKATAAMAKVVKGLGASVTVPAKLGASVFGGAGKGLSALGSGLKGLGVAALGAGAGGLLGLKGVLDTLSDTAAMDRAAKAFGLTSEAASGLFGVMKANGADNIRENIESVVTLSGRIKDVLTGTGEESKKLFDGLSISAEQMSKLPIDEQFFKLHESIMQLADPVERVNKLMLAYGEDGGKTLIGTLSQSTAQLRAQSLSHMPRFPLNFA